MLRVIIALALGTVVGWSFVAIAANMSPAAAPRVIGYLDDDDVTLKYVQPKQGLPVVPGTGATFDQGDSNADATEAWSARLSDGANWIGQAAPLFTRISDGADAISTPTHGTSAGVEAFTLAISPVYQDALDATQARQLEAYGMGIAHALPTLIGIGVTDDPEAPRIMGSEPGPLAEGLVVRHAGQLDSRIMDGFGQEIWSDEVAGTGVAATGSITCAAPANIANSGDYVALTGLGGTEYIFEFDKDGSGVSIAGAIVVDISASVTDEDVATALASAITTHAYFTASALAAVVSVTQPTKGTDGNNTITTNNLSTTVSGFSGGVEVEYALAVVDREVVGKLDDIDAKLAQTTCQPDLTTDETCLETCLLNGTVTASIPAGDYMMSVFGETTWVKVGTTLAAGGTRYTPGTQIPITIATTADYACRSAGGTGDVCFVPCL